MKIKKILFFTLFFSTIVNARQNIYDTFSAYFITFPKVENEKAIFEKNLKTITEYSTFVNKDTQSIHDYNAKIQKICDRNGIKPESLRFQLKIYDTTMRILQAIEKALDTEKRLRKIAPQTGYNRLLDTSYKINLLFVFAEFILNRIDSYEMLCEYLKLEADTRTVFFDSSIPIQLDTFKIIYENSKSLQEALNQEVVDKKTPSLIYLREYLNKEFTNRADATQYIAKLRENNFAKLRENNSAESSTPSYLDDDTEPVSPSGTIKKVDNAYPEDGFFGDIRSQKALPYKSTDAPRRDSILNDTFRKSLSDGIAQGLVDQGSAGKFSSKGSTKSISDFLNYLLSQSYTRK
jgi:hypothetical protein